MTLGITPTIKFMTHAIMQPNQPKNGLICLLYALMHGLYYTIHTLMHGHTYITYVPKFGVPFAMVTLMWMLLLHSLK